MSDTEVKIVPALLNVPVTPLLAARLGVVAPAHVNTDHTDVPDYSDGYGGTYAQGE